MVVFISCLAAERGLEPRQTDSKSAVLPLHNSAISLLCRRSGSNRHESCLPTVFETVASACSATSARCTMERKTRFELATSSLARRHSTTELLPPGKCRGPESDWRHADFQSAALPTELPRHTPNHSIFYQE